MYRLLSDIITQNKARYFQISKARADVRFAMFIQDLSRRFSLRGYSPREFRLPMTRGDIANYLGLTPETISREITKLEQLDVLRFRRRFITINHPGALDALIMNK
ncbi:TPA: helix-turn-helix domain-containing protein [Serratia liquefaciens]|nr:helix-turn-helix domain-containing protein [Serratia liquefaciens]